MKAQMVGGPEDGRDDFNVAPGATSILIYSDGAHWRCPVRDQRVYWNERVRES